MNKSERQIHEKYLEYLNSRIKSTREAMIDTVILEREFELEAQLDRLMLARYNVELALALAPKEDEEIGAMLETLGKIASGLTDD